MPRKGQPADPEQVRKSRETRMANAKVRRDEAIWRIIEPELSTCKCGLEKGMTLEKLRPLGAGCTGGHGYTPGWVCPVLDRYRRLLDGAWSGYKIEA